MYTNIRGLQGNLNDLSCTLSDTTMDIVILTETWCNEAISSAILQIPGYYIDDNLRKDRTDTMNGCGGGIIVYVRNGLTILSSDISSDFNQYCNFDVLTEDSNSDPINITAVYRSPNSTLTNTEKLCNIVSDMKNNSILIGDINLPKIDWENCTADSKGRNFLEATQTNFVSQMIDFPTHNKGNILDLLLTKKPEKIASITDIGPIGNSDHTSIVIEFYHRCIETKTVQYIYDWNKANEQGLVTEMGRIDWSAELSGLNTEDSWKSLQFKIQDLTDKYVPKKVRRSTHKPLWLNRKVLRASRRKQRLYNKYKESKSPVDYKSFRDSVKEVKKLVRNAKKSFEQKLARNPKQNVKSFNGYVKSRTKARSGVGPLKNNGNTVTDDKEMANILNTFFASVFTIDDGNNGPPITPADCNQLEYINFSAVEIKTKIDKLKPASAPGNDNITVKQLQLLRDQVCVPLEIIFTRSLESGEVPQSWREANVTPIFKKGTKSSASNYRPVSLTSICGKIMESLLCDKMVQHLTDQNLINSSQHGFLKNKSCLTNLLEFMELVTSKFDDGNALDLIYLDFAKAFDKVPKRRLIKKTQALGISGKLLAWIDSWLSNRLQRVVINGFASDWAAVLSGVPQGSILGPLLFLVYINDIDSAVMMVINIIRKFADDTKVAHTVNSEQDRKTLQSCLDNLVKWSQNWGMEFNIPKCKVIHVGKKNHRFSYFMNGIEVTKTNQEKDIGVMTHESLKPSSQCLLAAKKANFVLGQISRAFHYRDSVTFLNLYKTYVRPHLEFSVPAWCPWKAEDIMVLENVQRRALNMISNLKGKTYQEKLKETKLQTLEDRRLRFAMIQTYNTLNQKVDVDPGTWFTRVQETSQRNTRLSNNRMNLQLKQCRGEVRRNFFSIRVIQPWNDLPDEIRNAVNTETFKRLYDRVKV